MFYNAHKNTIQLMLERRTRKTFSLTREIAKMGQQQKYPRVYTILFITLQRHDGSGFSSIQHRARFEVH
jgi:hypothetical protein